MVSECRGGINNARSVSVLYNVSVRDSSEASSLREPRARIVSDPLSSLYHIRRVRERFSIARVLVMLDGSIAKLPRRFDGQWTKSHGTSASLRERTYFSKISGILIAA